MKEKLKISAALALTLSGIFLLRSVAPAAPGQGAAVYMVDNVTIQSLHSLYDSPAPSDAKVKVFVMPGHEPDYGGAEYRDVKERDLNLVIGEYLKGFLENDSHYDVTLGRDENGWNPDIAAYFKDHAKDIAAWHDDQKKIMAGLVDSGEVKVDRDPAIHQVVPDDVAMRLYGLNKWIGENKFDIALHIHINDYGTRPGNSPGEFSGYVIYEPYHQYSNSAAAAALASALKTRLDTVIARSDAPKEAAGVVEDQQLIALGRYNTADTPSLLIEYGYI